jgi:hypothetical protein
MKRVWGVHFADRVDESRHASNGWIVDANTSFSGLQFFSVWIARMNHDAATTRNIDTTKSIDEGNSDSAKSLMPITLLIKLACSKLCFPTIQEEPLRIPEYIDTFIQATIAHGLI